MEQLKSMQELEDYVLENYVNRLVKKHNNKKVILEKDLIALKLNNAEMIFIRQVLMKHKIDLIDEEIKRIDRPSLVRDYNYGKISTLEIDEIDKSVMAKLEYDEDGNLIYEDYKKLDDFLENEFIPEHVRTKRRLDKETGEYNIFPSIQLNKIVRLQLCEQEVKHVIKYLNEQGIHVGGISSTLDGEFENYDYVSTYKTINLKPKLSADEILTKIKFYKQNPTKELKDEIIEDNMRLAFFVSYKIARAKKIDIYELLSYAYEGLIEAIDGFKPELGYKFSSYACPTIRGYILSGIHEILGYSSDSFYSRILPAKRAVEEELCTTLEHNPEIVDDIVDLLIATGEFSEKMKDKVKTGILLTVPDSLDERMDNKYIEAGYSDDYLCNDFNDECLHQDNLLPLEVTNDIIKEIFAEVLDTLTERERIIIIERFGLIDGKCKSLIEIGKIFNRSNETIRQIESKVLRKLRHPWRSRKLRDYLKEYNEYSYNPNLIVDYQNYQKIKK